jgi:hypothetical protein
MPSLTIYAPATTGMNVLMLCLVLPFFFALLAYDARLAYVLYHTSEEARRVAWGGLQGKLFYVGVLTYLLSSFGCTSTFVLYASRDTADGFSIFLFLVLNVSCLAFNYALLRDKKNTVLVCLWTNVAVLTTLFVYTAVVFKWDSHTSNADLLVATHVCNFVSVFHVYVMDLMIWYSGWIDERDAWKTSLELTCQT